MSDHRNLATAVLPAAVLAAAAVAGLIKGAAEYAARSHVLERHVPGTNAITVHVVLACAAAATVLAVQADRAIRRDHRGLSPWTAPFSGRAAARLWQAVRVSPVRAVLMALPLLVMLYAPYRMGMQVIGGLDPNATVNAWGGPTYAGALAAHWLDCLIGFYIAAFLLARLRPRR